MSKLTKQQVIDVILFTEKEIGKNTNKLDIKNLKKMSISDLTETVKMLQSVLLIKSLCPEGSRILK